MNYINTATFLDWPRERKLKYLAKAKKGGVVRILRNINGNTVPHYRPAIRMIPVSKQEFTDRAAAYHVAKEMLTKIQEQAQQLQ